VEDEEGVRRFATDLLTENGYIIVEAASAEDAMEVFEKEKRRFHLAFVDVILPGKTGLQLVDQLLSLKPELSVLLSSGYTEEQSKLSEIRNRGIRFIQKPYSIRKILQTIREILESKQVYP
jgi:two-component system cell cycle sensor histidine kinase/response regulator CckA